MAKLVFGMMQSLDGYVDHLELGPPGPVVSRHFIEHVRDLTGMIYGRRVYENHALLGGRPSRLGCGGSQLRGGLAEQAEVGCVTLVEVGRAQRHTCRA